MRGFTFRRVPVLAFAALLLTFANDAGAWSYKEHIQLTRIAVGRLIADPGTPEEMRRWLRSAVPQTPDLGAEREYFMTARVGRDPAGLDGMLHWVCVPDIRSLRDPKESTIEPFGVHERKLHFIDLEYFQPGDRKRGYRHDLSGKPRPEDIPRDMSDPRFAQAGMLPFRVEQCYNELVKSIRERRLHAATLAEQEGRTATYWAGYLAHYLADNTQPHHATLDYKSQSYFANKRKAPNVHNEMEYRMHDDERERFPKLQQEYWPLFEAALKDVSDPIESRDPFVATLQVSFISYDALPLIGEAAMRAAGQRGTPDDPVGDVSGKLDTEAFFHHRGTFRGKEMSVMEMKALHTAWAVKRIEKTLRHAWDEAKGQ